MLDKDICRFSARFGLTAAEARILREIIGGKGLLSAAARLNIGESTARTHTRRIFDKTGTKRQTELIHGFFESAFPDTPQGA
jgi:DNA-binding CsgD family transcriptional regulator